MKNDSLGNRFKLSWDIRREYPRVASDIPPASPSAAHCAGTGPDPAPSENRLNLNGYRLTVTGWN